MVIVFITTFNNISVICGGQLEEPGVSRKNHRPAARH